MRRERSVRDGGGALSEEQLERLARYFDEEVISEKNYKISWVEVLCAATG
jgi:hypothetical protein